MQTCKRRYRLLFWIGFPIGILATLFLLFCYADVPFWNPFWRTYLIGMLAVLFLLYLFYAFLRLAGGKRLRRFSAIATGVLFLIVVYAMVISTFNIRIDKVNLSRANPERFVPQGLRGYRILQISDMHIGSFTSPKQVRRLVHQALNTNPDMVVFTGDMVNFSASEMSQHLTELAHLSAPDGVYCVLGNHDYGGYVRWADTAARHANLQKMLQYYKHIGWTCLNNASVKIERGGDTLHLVGVENWGREKRFPKRGDLKVALSPSALLETRRSLSAVENEDFAVNREPQVYTVLLSHDPTYFDSAVYLRYPQIDLTLAGHTHGMQLGLRINGKDYSPARFVYEHFSGLYVMANGQALYVNTGCGFNGIPFRLGMRPVFTLFEF